MIGVTTTHSGGGALERLRDATRPAALQRVALAEADDVRQDIRQRMVGPKHGRMYGDHQASAAGEPPAVDTQHLYNSLQTRVDGSTGAAVFTEDPKGPMLEHGTVRMAARPVWGPVARDHVKPFVDRMLRHLQAAVR